MWGFYRQVHVPTPCAQPPSPTVGAPPPRRASAAPPSRRAPSPLERLQSAECRRAAFARQSIASATSYALAPKSDAARAPPLPDGAPPPRPAPAALLSHQAQPPPPTGNGDGAMGNIPAPASPDGAEFHPIKPPVGRRIAPVPSPNG